MNALINTKPLPFCGSERLFHAVWVPLVLQS